MKVNIQLPTKGKEWADVPSETLEVADWTQAVTAAYGMSYALGGATVRLTKHYTDSEGKVMSATNCNGHYISWPQFGRDRLKLIAE